MILALLGLVSLLSVNAFAQDSKKDVQCMSEDGSEQTCEVGGRIAAVSLQAELSRMRRYGVQECIEGSTYGHHLTSVWVSGGCSANFTVELQSEE